MERHLRGAEASKQKGAGSEAIAHEMYNQRALSCLLITSWTQSVARDWSWLRTVFCSWTILGLRDSASNASGGKGKDGACDCHWLGHHVLGCSFPGALPSTFRFSHYIPSKDLKRFCPGRIHFFPAGLPWRASPLLLWSLAANGCRRQPTHGPLKTGEDCELNGTLAIRSWVDQELEKRAGKW